MLSLRSPTYEMGLRVSEEEELMGVDVHECGIDAYPEFVTVKSSI
ncbi:hypothetical protein [Aeromonas australiensis]|nr:hypothetical protein [Aeromonas australiensis]